MLNCVIQAPSIVGATTAPAAPACSGTLVANANGTQSCVTFIGYTTAGAPVYQVYIDNKLQQSDDYVHEFNPFFKVYNVNTGTVQYVQYVNGTYQVVNLAG